MELDIYTSDPVLMHSELVLKKNPIPSPPPPIEFSKNYPTSSEAQEQTMDPSGLLFVSWGTFGCGIGLVLPLPRRVSLGVSKLFADSRADLLSGGWAERLLFLFTL